MSSRCPTCGEEHPQDMDMGNGNVVDYPCSKQTAHTPGPWRSQGWVPTWAYIPVKNARHDLVCSVYPDTSHGYTRDEAEADARLIAAAPDLLAAIVNSDDAHWTPAMRAAMAKARGER
jgi:hypothetical protein